MVHEFVKTITQFYYEELHKEDQVLSLEEKKHQVIQYLNSTSHITQFLEHFTDQGKLLSDIAYQLLFFNRKMLDLVMYDFRVYIFTAGILLVLAVSIVILLWIKRLVSQLALIKLALINIPYDNLLEAKTISVIKALENI